MHRLNRPACMQIWTYLIVLSKHFIELSSEIVVVVREALAITQSVCARVHVGKRSLLVIDKVK